MQDMELHSEDAGRRLQVSQQGLGNWIGRIDEHGKGGRRSPPGDLFEDIGGCGGPDEGAWIGIVMLPPIL